MGHRWDNDDDGSQGSIQQDMERAKGLRIRSNKGPGGKNRTKVGRHWKDVSFQGG